MYIISLSQAIMTFFCTLDKIAVISGFQSKLGKKSISRSIQDRLLISTKGIVETQKTSKTRELKLK